MENKENTSKKISVIIITVSVIFFLLLIALIVVNISQGNEEQRAGSGDATKTQGEFSGKLIANPCIKNTVPVIEYYVDDSSPKCLVILQHGLTSKKEEVADLARGIAENGFYVVTPDAYGHGENYGDPPLSVMEAAAETSANYDKVVSAYEENQYVDTQNFGIVGFSLGGLAAYHYLAYGQEAPKVIGTFCATPRWEDMIGRDVVYETYTIKQTTYISDEKERARIETYIKENSPYKELENLKDTFICMLGGEKDDLIPSEGMEAYYSQMKDVLPNMTLIIYPNIGHEVSIDGLETMIAYFEEHLKVTE